jgi:GLPGLI family protein
MMMNNTTKTILLICLLCTCFVHFSNAQSIINNGLVRFERKVNLHKQMEGWSETWSEAMKKNTPKYSVSAYDLQFTTMASSFKKSEDQPPVDPRLRNSWMRDENDANITYKNIQTHQIIAQKQVFEKIFLIKDSLQPIQWKITNEFKKIADKNCRKATTILMDSLYIIAYYTDDIVCSSGPEGLHGLPGMILGVVIPRLNTSYFATLVTPYTDPTIAEMPSKGTAINYKQLLQKLDKSLDDWGKKWKVKTVWGLML